MRSIRRRLFLHLAIGLVILLSICGTGFYVYVWHALIRQFDDSLISQLRDFLATTEREDLAEYAVYLSEGSIAMPGSSASYIEIRNETGTVIARTPSLDQRDLGGMQPRGPSPLCRDVLLPGGRHGRAAAIRFIPRVEDEGDDAEPPPHSGSTLESGQPLIATMARSREDLDATLRVLLIALLAMGFALPAAAILLVGWITRRELAPLQQIADAATEISPQELGRRLPIEEVPSEVLPLCLRLNELLDRLESAFRRERRFTAAAAHELRTPVSELRVLAEVALQSWEDSGLGKDQYSYFEDTLGIALQMERLVTTLLALTRCEAGIHVASTETVDLAALLRQAWVANQTRCEVKDCTTAMESPERLLLETDPVLAGGILANLVSNAVTHVPRGGHISLRLLEGDQDVLVEVTNTHDTLESTDLEHLFEPFWRKDVARADATHTGLGLTLAASYAHILGATIEADLRSPAMVAFQLRLPKPA